MPPGFGFTPTDETVKLPQARSADRAHLGDWPARRALWVNHVGRAPCHAAVRSIRADDGAKLAPGGKIVKQPQCQPCNPRGSQNADGSRDLATSFWRPNAGVLGIDVATGEGDWPAPLQSHTGASATQVLSSSRCGSRRTHRQRSWLALGRLWLRSACPSRPGPNGSPSWATTTLDVRSRDATAECPPLSVG